MIQKILLLLVLASLMACSTGRKITQQELSQVKVGQTTSDFLEKKFGEPYTEMTGTNEGSFYTAACGKRSAPIQIWGYHGIQRSLASERITLTTFLINKQGRVCKVFRQKART